MDDVLKEKEPTMLSPEAELRALVETVAEPNSVDQGDYIPLRKVRAILAHGIRAAGECGAASETVKLALLDLDRTSEPYRD